MKVIKIDVKQEILDVEPRPEYLFHRLPEDYATRIVNDGEVPPDSVEIFTEKYRAMKFFNPNSKEKMTIYLIKFSDNDLVNNLVKIENDVLEAKIEQVKIKIYNEIVNRIKKLTWWKRLLNKF